MPCYDYQTIVLRNAIQTQGFNREFEGVEKILHKIETENPRVAAQLRALDWEAITKFVARNALEKVAAEIGADLEDEYQETARNGYEASGQGVPQGMVGALHHKGVQLGLAVSGTQCTFVHDAYDAKNNSVHLKNLKQKVEQAYREESIKAVLRILGGEVAEQKGPAGTVLFQTKIKGGA